MRKPAFIPLAAGTLLKTKSLVALIFAILSGTLCPLAADVKMPAIFGDHMVLQQGTKLPVWGTAEAGEKVTVTVGSQSATAITGADGRWRVDLAPLPAATAPVTMSVAGKTSLTFSDVLIGDVWICSGQSNMEFGLGNEYDAQAQIAKADIPLLRLFLVPKKTALDPQTDLAPAPASLPLEGHWVVCNPDNVIKIGGWTGFSAAGYFFGQEIARITRGPVGLIGTYWGGTPAQSWTSLEKLQSDPVLKHYADAFASIKTNFPQAQAEYGAKLAAFREDLPKWRKEMGLAPNAPIGPAEVVKAQAMGLPPPPRQPPPPDGGSSTPSILYNGMIAPLIPYAIKGVIWYQGESNAGRAFEYTTLFSAMITDWRQRWGQGDFPFLFVQLAKFQEPNPTFDLLREAQLKTLAVPNTGMAVAFDVGDQKDLHPKDKRDVGLRLALAAEHLAYGKNLVYSGPIYDKMRIENGAIRVSFTQVGGGLEIGTAPWTPPTSTPVPNTTLAGFMIAGADKKWVPADARIDGNDVVVSSPATPQPVAVRYAMLLTDANLYNKEGLPASPFRTDDWDVRPPKPAASAVVAPAPTAAK